MPCPVATDLLLWLQISTSTVSGVYPYVTRLNVSDVSMSDLGEFTCTASNSIGDSSVGIDLTVKSKLRNSYPNIPAHTIPQNAYPGVQIRQEHFIP